MAVIDKNDYTKWLAFEIDLYGRYHNHKETMAWVITALYVPAIIYLGYREGAIWRGTGWEWGISVLVLLVSYLVGIFVNMQFSMRWKAADGVKALRQLWAEFNKSGTLPRRKGWSFKEDKDLWPSFVQDRIKKRNEGKRNCGQAFSALWKMLIWYPWRRRKNDKNKDKVDDRWKTELPSYFLVLIATVIAILLSILN